MYKECLKKGVPFNVDEDTAERAQDLIDEGIDENEAIEIAEEM